MTYRQTQLAKAETELSAARAAYASAKSTKAKLSADEDIQFWSSKVAFLSSVYYGALEDEKEIAS